DFMEGGIDLAAIGATGCVSTFIPHTRSAQQFTATLKDFAGPRVFSTCKQPGQPGGTTTTTSTTAAPGGTTTAPTSAVLGAQQELPRTGANIATETAAGGLLIGFGVFAMVAGNLPRRRSVKAKS